jgi:hypothetical protein
MTDVHIVLPERSVDAVSGGLRYLTEVLCVNKIGDDTDGSGGLGGDYGYGVDFENDTFMLHRFCWCEQDDCPWCAGCECPSEAFHYFVDGEEVTCDRWMGFFDEMTGGWKPWRERRSAEEQRRWERAAKEANQRRSTRHDPICRVCRGEFGNAPNFLHKPSGSTVRWYKWIGRGNEVDLRQPWDSILADCLRSIGA